MSGWQIFFSVTGSLVGLAGFMMAFARTRWLRDRSLDKLASRIAAIALMLLLPIGGFGTGLWWQTYPDSPTVPPQLPPPFAKPPRVSQGPVEPLVPQAIKDIAKFSQGQQDRLKELLISISNSLDKINSLIVDIGNIQNTSRYLFETPPFPRLYTTPNHRFEQIIAASDAVVPMLPDLINSLCKGQYQDFSQQISWIFEGCPTIPAEIIRDTVVTGRLFVLWVEEHQTPLPNASFQKVVNPFFWSAYMETSEISKWTRQAQTRLADMQHFWSDPRQ